MPRSRTDLLKTYAVFASGDEGVAFKLVETFWYRRAVAAFNAAKDSGRWSVVQVKLGPRVCVTFRKQPAEPPQAPAPALRLAHLVRSATPRPRT
jgi:hypothetical protein